MGNEAEERVFLGEHQIFPQETGLHSVVALDDAVRLNAAQHDTEETLVRATSATTTSTATATAAAAAAIITGSGSYPSLHARRHCSGDSRAVDLAIEAVV